MKQLNGGYLGCIARRVPLRQRPSMLLAAASSVAAHAIVAVAQWKLHGAGNVWPSTALYYAGATLLLAAYALAILVSRQSISRREMGVLVAVPAVLHAAWLVPLPSLAIDAYSYVVDAARFAAGLSPYQHAVRDAAGTPLGQQLADYGWRPVHGISPYGPVWMTLMRLLGPVAADIETAVRLVKAIALVATALTAWLIYYTAPAEWRVPAFTAFWWNPAVIIESAGEGHNDALMVCAVIFALWAVARRAPVAAASGLAIAVLTKWLPLLFAPAFVAYAWRRGWLRARTIAGGLIAIVAVAGLAFWPVWAGLDTFNGLRRLGEPRLVASTVGTLGMALGPGFYEVMRALTSMVALAIACYGAWTSRTHSALVRACGLTAVVYFLVASPLFWAWYLLLPIGLLVLTPDLPLVLVLTTASRAVAPLDVLRLRGGISWVEEAWLTTVLGLWIPLAFIAWRLWRRRGPAARMAEHGSSGSADRTSVLPV